MANMGRLRTSHHRFEQALPQFSIQPGSGTGGNDDRFPIGNVTTPRLGNENRERPTSLWRQLIRDEYAKQIETARVDE